MIVWIEETPWGGPISCGVSADLMLLLHAAKSQFQYELLSNRSISCVYYCKQIKRVEYSKESNRAKHTNPNINIFLLRIEAKRWGKGH